MSKKQREKVEDEVRFHRAQMRAQSDAAPDSSVYDTQTPSSSDQLQHNNYNRCSTAKYYAILHSLMRYTYLLVYPYFSLSLALSLPRCHFLLLSFTLSVSPSLSHSYSGGYSNNEVGYGSPYGYSASVTPQQTMQYDISADYVDSTTYEPRSTMIDPEFISHGKYAL